MRATVISWSLTAKSWLEENSLATKEMQGEKHMVSLYSCEDLGCSDLEVIWKCHFHLLASFSHLFIVLRYCPLSGITSSRNQIFSVSNLIVKSSLNSFLEFLTVFMTSVQKSPFNLHKTLWDKSKWKTRKLDFKKRWKYNSHNVLLAVARTQTWAWAFLNIRLVRLGRNSLIFKHFFSKSRLS